MFLDLIIKMTLKLSKSDYRFLQVLFKLDCALAIVPWYSFKTSSLTHPLLNKLQSVVFSTAITCWSLYSFCARQKLRDAYYTTTMVVLDYLHDFGVLFVAISIILSSCLFNQDRWLELNSSFQLLDKKLDTKNRKVEYWAQSLLVQLILNHVVFMGTFIYLTCGLAFDVKEYDTDYWADLLCWFYFLHVEVLMYNLAQALKCRYEHLNEFLERGLTGPWYVDSRVNCIRESGNITRIFGEIVAGCNAIFGWSLLSVVGLTVVDILMCLNFVVEDIDVTSSVKIANVVMAALILVSTSMVIMSCDFAKQESQKTVSLCYKLQEQLPSNSSERKELLRLAKIASNNVARFTAADFFELNRGTLCTILGTTTTYLIVMIQFNNNTSK